MADFRQLIPVASGDLVRIEINGVGQLYRARKSARDIGDLRLRDLVADPEADAIDFLINCIEGGHSFTKGGE
jgi:hypothetical protein